MLKEQRSFYRCSLLLGVRSAVEMPVYQPLIYIFELWGPDKLILIAINAEYDESVFS